MERTIWGRSDGIWRAGGWWCCLFFCFALNRYITHPAFLLHIAALDPTNLKMSLKYPPFIFQTFYFFKIEARKGTKHMEKDDVEIVLIHLSSLPVMGQQRLKCSVGHRHSIPYTRS